MLTRRAKLQLATSNKPFQTKSEMSDAKKTASLRKKLGRLHSKVTRSQKQLATQREEAVPENAVCSLLEESQEQLELFNKEYSQLSEELFEMESIPKALATDEELADEFYTLIRLARMDCKQLMSAKITHGTTDMLEAAVRCLSTRFEAHPENDHSTAIADVEALTKTLTKELLSTTMPEMDDLKTKAKDVLERAGLIQGRASGVKMVDVKPIHSHTSGRSGVKLKYQEVPEFSGRTEDWLTFLRMFKNAVHNNPDLETATKLQYLVQSLKDPVQKAIYADRMEEDGAYEKFMEELTLEYDRPRWLHRRYCEQMRMLTTNPHTRPGLKELVSKITTIHKGFVRLKTENVSQVLTSMAEAVMDKQLRELWNQRTDKIKETPPIEDLLSFITDQANQMEEGPTKQITTTPTKSQYDRRPKPQSKFKGNSYVVTTPSQVAAPKPTQPKQSNSQPANNSYQGKTYVCTLCQENHLLYYCPIFTNYDVAKRKEFVMTNKLCLNCLKAHHLASECRSSYRCREDNCQRKHNTLLHETRPAAPATQPVNFASHQTNAEKKQGFVDDGLLMTTQVTLTGPTGNTVTVRALLDSGSSVSLISKKMMKRLALKDTGETVSVRGVGASGKTSNHPTSQVTLTSRFQKNWVRDIGVIGMEQMTEAMPTQQISYVRNLPYLKGLELADDQFDVPGKIDLLLGQNVYKHLLLPQCITGPKDQPDARLTVFGWALMGPYTHNFQQNSKTAITCVAAAEAEDSVPLNSLLRRFWEVEEIIVFKTEFTPTEKKVEEHYSQTHQYLAEEKRYLVRLPKIEKEAELGESHTQALNRAKANERSLLRRNVWPQFQEVMKEYVDLGHAKPVLLSDSQPATAAYFMPVHAVFKSSSTSTKIRAVFDASAITTNKLSLNDLLEVGPTLHPTLDQILMKFRTYAIAVTGDIQKMYREVMLHPEDQPLHRFVWRQKTNEDWQEYQMTRVTFGVTSSPYLAVKTLQTTGQEFGNEDPTAQWHILKSFYVDDLMAGADTIKEAIALYQSLKTILSHASFNLKKWRSSSKEVLKSIPADLQEKLPTQELVRCVYRT